MHCIVYYTACVGCFLYTTAIAFLGKDTMEETDLQRQVRKLNKRLERLSLNGKKLEELVARETDRDPKEHSALASLLYTNDAAAFKAAVARSLSLLNTSDFYTTGMTEGGFKGLIMGVLGNDAWYLANRDASYPSVDVYSEYSLKGGRMYADIVVQHGSHYAVVELKYVQMKYLPMMKIALNERHYFENAKPILMNMDEDQLLALEYDAVDPRKSKNNSSGKVETRTISISDVITEATEQIKRYMREIRFSPSEGKVTGFVVVGVGPRVIVRAVEFKI
jgi:hypothetical protein